MIRVSVNRDLFEVGGGGLDFFNGHPVGRFEHSVNPAANLQNKSGCFEFPRHRDLASVAGRPAFLDLLMDPDGFGGIAILHRRVSEVASSAAELHEVADGQRKADLVGCSVAAQKSGPVNSGKSFGSKKGKVPERFKQAVSG